MTDAINPKTTSLAGTSISLIIGIPFAVGFWSLVMYGPIESPIMKRYLGHPVEFVEIVMFSCAIKALVFKKVSKKIAFGSFFFFTLAFLELRLNILIVRMRFAIKLLIANEAITNGSILVNNKKRSIHYLTRVNDVVQKQLKISGSKKPKILKRRK